MKTKVKSISNRKYFIDWLRISLILSVFLYHIGMYFNTWDWHVKNNELTTSLNKLMRFLHLWRMPLLFLVSGVGTFYALGYRNTKQYLKERFNRIFIPFLIGVLTLVPIQVYLERIENYSSLWNYYLHMFDGIYPKGNFSWHHLWFLLYLFLISLLISPFLRYLRSEKFQHFQLKMIAFLSKPLALNLIAVILITSQAILRQFFPESTHALYNDWAYFVYYLLFFLAGFILMTNEKMTDAIMNQRRLFLVETILCTAFMFSVSSMFINRILMDWLYGISGILIGWSCGITALGYAKKYLNFNSKWRKVLNEGIYPFYLLHQPVILIFGFYFKDLEISIPLKFGLLTICSFLSSSLIYWFFIKRFNITRIMFGLKKIKKH